MTARWRLFALATAFISFAAPSRAEDTIRLAIGLRGNWASAAAEIANVGGFYRRNGVEVGVHLCYGDPGHKHIVEPRDTGTCVAFANAIWGEAKRKVEWIHLPIPRGWDQDGYYEPLEKLRRPAGAQVFIGLVHFTGGIEGTERRLALTLRHVDHFGIAT